MINIHNDAHRVIVDVFVHTLFITACLKRQLETNSKSNWTSFFL